MRVFENERNQSMQPFNCFERNMYVCMYACMYNYIYARADILDDTGISVRALLSGTYYNSLACSLSTLLYTMHSTLYLSIIYI